MSQSLPGLFLLPKRRQQFMGALRSYKTTDELPMHGLEAVKVTKYQCQDVGNSANASPSNNPLSLIFT